MPERDVIAVAYDRCLFTCMGGVKVSTVGCPECLRAVVAEEVAAAERRGAEGMREKAAKKMDGQFPFHEVELGDIVRALPLPGDREGAGECERRGAKESEVLCGPRDQCRLWILWFYDQDAPPILFSGKGAEDAARRAFEKANMAWTCHLLATVTHSPGFEWGPPLPGDREGADRA